MKRGLTVEWEGDGELVIRKSRGKFTLEEIEETLRYGRDASRNALCGNYALILRCGEESIGGNGLYDLGFEEPKGDIVRLQLLDDWGNCPVCREMLPPIKYCPHCLKDLSQKPD